MGRGKMPVEKRSFLKNGRLFLRAREKIFNNFKSKIFPIKNQDENSTPDAVPEPAPKLQPRTKHLRKVLVFIWNSALR